jgi:hypothetical protein
MFSSQSVGSREFFAWPRASSIFWNVRSAGARRSVLFLIRKVPRNVKRIVNNTKNSCAAVASDVVGRASVLVPAAGARAKFPAVAARERG